MNEPSVRIATQSTSKGASVLRVELNRPSRRNAIDAEIIRGIESAVRTVHEQPNIRAVLLSGTGKAFCAGADLEWMRAQSATAETNQQGAADLATLYSDWHALSVPTIARVHGAAIGGGAGLVAACDIVVAANTAFFAVPEVRLGLIPAVIAPFVIEKIGVSRAREWMLSGRRVGADEALAAGMVHRVVAEDELDTAIDVTVAEVLQAGPAALGHVKRLLAQLPVAAASGRESVNRTTALALAKVRAGDEARAGIAAFLNKKNPPWTGDPEERS